jgi:hypothetical protein
MILRKLLCSTSCVVLIFIQATGFAQKEHSISIANLSQVAANESSEPDWPPNIVVPKGLSPFLRTMLDRSPTFRHQWERIAVARQLLIRVVVTTPFANCGCRAFSVAEHYADGSIRVTVYLFAPHAKDPELIAHEFEHALEQADGLNLKTLANVRGSGVYQPDEDSFETLRARRAGDAVSNEFFSHHEGN